MNKLIGYLGSRVNGTGLIGFSEVSYFSSFSGQMRR